MGGFSSSGLAAHGDGGYKMSLYNEVALKEGGGLTRKGISQ